MPQEFSFDVVSKVDLQEVTNAVSRPPRRSPRGSISRLESKIEWNDKELELTLTSDDEGKLKSVKDILETRLVKRGVALKALDYGKVEPAARAPSARSSRSSRASRRKRRRRSSRRSRTEKLKVQASIQADQVRVTGRDKDELQEPWRCCAPGTSACRCSSRTTDDPFPPRRTSRLTARPTT